MLKLMALEFMRGPTLSGPLPPLGKHGWPWSEGPYRIPDKMPDGSAWPRVSIVTPSFNQAQFLEETIRSVLLQGYPNLEYIIIDGGSTDGSVEIIKKYEPYLAYWVSEPDRGQAHAINKGFSHATGEIFAWVNSDDMLLPYAVALAACYLREHPKIGVVTGDRIFIDKTSKYIGYRAWKLFMPWQFRYCCGIAQEATFWRRDIFFACGGLDETLHFAMDFDLWIRFLKFTKIHYIPAFMGVYRSHASAKSTKVRLFQQNKGYAEDHETIALHAETRAVRIKHFGRDPSRIERNILRVSHSLLRKAYQLLGFYLLAQKSVHRKLTWLRSYQKHFHISSL